MPEPAEPDRRSHRAADAEDIWLGFVRLFASIRNSVGGWHPEPYVGRDLTETPPLPGDFPISIYLADENVHEETETAVEQWLDTAHLGIATRGKPVIGSWFRRMTASLKEASQTPTGREVLLTATHIADSRLVQSQDAYVTATLLQNVGPVLQALQPTKDAVVRAGALLIVKIDWTVQVHQLTAAQQAMLDHQPRLAASPTEIIAALQLQGPVIQEATIRPTARHDSGGETAATAAN